MLHAIHTENHEIPNNDIEITAGCDLTEKCLLSKITIHQWTANKLDKEITAEVAERAAADKNVGRYTKKLIPKEAFGEINKIVREIREFHEKHTLPWLDNGYRILPANNYKNYVSEMRTFKERYHDAVQEFLYQYENLKSQAAIRLGTLFREDEYPDASELEEKFKLRTSIIPLPETQDFRVQLSQSEIEELRAEMQQKMAEAHAKAMKDLWERLYEPVSELATRLKDPEARFKVNLIRNIAKIVDLLPRLNFDNDPHLEQMRIEVERSLCDLDTRRLREDKEYRQDTAKSADNLIQNMAAYMGQL